MKSCKRVCLGLLIICLFTCHYHSKSVLAEEILLHLIAHGIHLKPPDDFFTLRVYQEINLILTNVNLMGSSSEHRYKERIYPSCFMGFKDYIYTAFICCSNCVHKILFIVCVYTVSYTFLHFYQFIYLNHPFYLHIDFFLCIF